MSETAAFNRLKKSLVRPGDRLDRVENVVLAGMPDVNGCFLGTEFWIELKSPTEPKRNSTALFGSNHKVTTEQRNWMLRQNRAGGNCYIYVKTDKRIMLVAGDAADEINDMTIAEMWDRAVWKTDLPVPKEEWTNLWWVLAT